MVKKLVTKAELARIMGVTAAVVTRHVKKDLAPAMNGRQIDLNHPAVKKWMKDREQPKTVATGIDPLYQNAINFCNKEKEFSANAIRRGLKIGASRAARIFKMMQAAGMDRPSKAPPPPPIKKQHAINTFDVGSDNIIYDIPDDIKEFIDMTLRELIQRFGTDSAFNVWLKATKAIEDINEKRLKNAATQGDLVNRQLVKTGVIDPINIVFQKLLSDGAKSIAVKVTTMTKAGRDLKECEGVIIDQISSFVRPAKIKMVRNLRNA